MSTTSGSAHGHPPACPKGKELFKLSIAALGVVYGDIGTSPLYAIKESFHAGHGLALTTANILGILSLVFWSLILVVCVKYLGFILRADNYGEGGITALLALLMPKFEAKNHPRARVVVITLGLLGAGLLYGDGIITPSISVLSAVEGLKIATPAFSPYVVPVTIAILVALFSVQRGGTAWIGAIFGPITAVWFLTLILTGLPWIFRRPEILAAINPYYAINFFIENGTSGFLVLSSVVLCITGGEALYADMGHFGRKPIRRSWYTIVFPALLINYFGQGAVVLEKGSEVLDHTFFSMVSGWMLYPLVLIATLAAVIASQALISGAFSLTQQSVQLGFFPRTTICHTSRETEGQIYVPRVNRLLMFACIATVLFFQESSNLAAAYGIAVTATMVITSMLFYLVARRIWEWSVAKAGSIVVLFLIMDLAFFLANATKIAHGGWIPVTIALLILAIMSTWKRGRQVLADSVARNAVTLDQFFSRVDADQPHRVRGTAVFMTLSTDVAPSVLLHHYTHNHILHERVILLSIQSTHRPEVSAIERCRVTDLSHGFVKIVARYGFMETPDVNEILDLASGTGLKMKREDLSFYLGRETFVTTGASGMPLWRKKLFVLLSRNSRTAAEYFNLPPDRVIELGSQVLI
jgi:KUP system potassium uptake protein